MRVFLSIFLISACVGLLVREFFRLPQSDEGRWLVACCKEHDEWFVPPCRGLARKLPAGKYLWWDTDNGFWIRDSVDFGSVLGVDVTPALSQRDLVAAVYAAREALAAVQERNKQDGTKEIQDARRAIHGAMKGGK